MGSGYRRFYGMDYNSDHVVTSVGGYIIRGKPKAGPMIWDQLFYLEKTVSDIDAEQLNEFTCRACFQHFYSFTEPMYCVSCRVRGFGLGLKEKIDKDAADDLSAE